MQISALAPQEHPLTRQVIEAGTPLPGLEVLLLSPAGPLEDYREAMELAKAEARLRQGDPMLVSWYDRDRDFESPQHASECHLDSAIPGYVDYGIHHGAGLMIDIEAGRFVFFFAAVEL